MYFEAVKRILILNLEAIANSRKMTLKQAVEAAAKHLSIMSEQWFAGKKPTIAYDDPLCRWAYVYAHAAVNANMFERVLSTCKRHKIFSDLLSEEEFSVLIFGGGPGTELLGLAKHYLGYEGDEGIEINVDIVDRVTEWSENITWIRGEIHRVYGKEFGKRRDWPARFNVTAYPLDFSDLKGFGNLPTLFEKDLFVFNFVVSEVFDGKQLLPLLRQMTKACDEGSFFLFVDRSDGETTSKIEDLIDKLKLETVDSGTTKSNMDGDEQKSVLKKLEKVIGRGPRVTWNANWYLAKVPE